jgi:hypothetical protein
VAKWGGEGPPRAFPLPRQGPTPPSPAHGPRGPAPSPKDLRALLPRQEGAPGPSGEVPEEVVEAAWGNASSWAPGAPEGLGASWGYLHFGLPPLDRAQAQELPVPGKALRRGTRGYWVGRGSFRNPKWYVAWGLRQERAPAAGALIHVSVGRASPTPRPPPRVPGGPPTPVGPSSRCHGRNAEAWKGPPTPGPYERFKLALQPRGARGTWAPGHPSPWAKGAGKGSFVIFNNKLRHPGGGRARPWGLKRPPGDSLRGAQGPGPSAPGGRRRRKGPSSSLRITWAPPRRRRTPAS